MHIIALLSGDTSDIHAEYKIKEYIKHIFVQKASRSYRDGLDPSTNIHSTMGSKSSLYLPPAFCTHFHMFYRNCCVSNVTKITVSCLCYTNIYL